MFRLIYLIGTTKISVIFWKYDCFGGQNFKEVIKSQDRKD